MMIRKVRSHLMGCQALAMGKILKEKAIGSSMHDLGQSWKHSQAMFLQREVTGLISV